MGDELGAAEFKDIRLQLPELNEENHAKPQQVRPLSDRVSESEPSKYKPEFYYPINHL
jgi:hypothetical protein